MKERLEFDVKRYRAGDALPAHGARAVLLIRHAPREGGALPGFATPLTEAGTEAARRLGHKWTGPVPRSIVTSPVPRCRRTAELIAQAAGWRTEIRESTLLGNPGTFVIDTVRVTQLVEESRESGELNFLHEHARGADVPGMRRRDEGAALLLTELRRLCPDGLLLAVSHDSIIACVLALAGHPPDPWPEPLCGGLIAFESRAGNDHGQ